MTLTFMRTMKKATAYYLRCQCSSVQFQGKSWIKDTFMDTEKNITLDLLQEKVKQTRVVRLTTCMLRIDPQGSYLRVRVNSVKDLT